MDTDSVIIASLIVVWGALEYRRRERKHKALLASLAHGGTRPGATGSPAVWKLLGEALMTLLLAAASALLFAAASRSHSPSPALYAMGGLFAAMAAIVVMMFLRDARRFRHIPGQSEGA